MLCEVDLWGNFWTTWALLSVVSFVLTMMLSGTVFYYYYQKATFQKW
jgi:hypothetical protein